MRLKTSITLPEELLRAVDRVAGRGSNRSRVIEEAIHVYLTQRARAARDARDLDILNRDADALNREVADALELQEEP